MIRRFLCATGLVVASALSGAAAGIEGDYIEARTADVFTGPCFSNSEIFTTGHQALLAWGVRQGSFQGVDLTGLSVAAALRGTTTFSEDDPSAARAVLIVDERANTEQREALVALAKHLGGERLQNVVGVESTRIALMVEGSHGEAGTKAHQLHPEVPQAPRASFWAAGLADIVTRPLDDNDHLCGNEVVAYAPLSSSVEVQPAYTLGHRFRGQGLDTTWSDANCRSAFVGHFSY